MTIDHYKQTLLRRKEELAAHSAQSKGTRQPVELDQTLQGRLSRQDAMMQQEMAKATERNRALEVQKIGAALIRIEAKEFGYCISCDEKIAEARLNNDPAVPTCIKCAQ